jgi:hypothetical protein
MDLLHERLFGLTKVAKGQLVKAAEIPAKRGEI